jgi:hypothetical protein
MSPDRDGGEETIEREAAGLTQRLVPEAIRSRFVVKFSIVLLIMGLAVGSIGAVGTIWLTFEDREPRGTTVTVRFPEHEGPEES